MLLDTKIQGLRHLGLTGLRFAVDSAQRAISTAREFNMDTKPLPASTLGCMRNPPTPVRAGPRAEHLLTNPHGWMDFE